MDLDFSDDQKQLRDQARRMFAGRNALKTARAVLDGETDYDRGLWKEMGALGMLGVAIPEQFGGSGAGYLELAVIAEELGRAGAAVPFQSSIYLAAELLLLAGTDAQKARWLRKLASGEVVGTLALFEGGADLSPGAVRLAITGNTLSGTKQPVPDGMIADIAVVAASDGSGKDSAISLFIVDLKDQSVHREKLRCVDPTRQHGALAFNNTPAERLGAAGEGWRLIAQLLNRAAVLVAFEQLGGSDRALEMARDYALERIAFGRPIGSFQGVKHMLADMYVSATLARSNCYYGAWALSTDAAELPEAAAAARLSATQAFQHCAKNNIHVHGGMGFTWAFDCHLFYRRANDLAVALGGSSYWEDQLIDAMRQRNTH